MTIDAKSAAESTRPEVKPPASSPDEFVQNVFYKITPVGLVGNVHSVGPLIPFGNGSGFLREIVISCRGMYDTAYAPVTVFNDEAVAINEKDVGREIGCRACLRSRQYVDGKGRLRWAMQLISDQLELTSAKTATAGQTDEKKPDIFDADEIPF